MIRTRIFTIASVVFLTSQAFGTPVALNSATTTYDQGSPYDISKTIDGSLSNGLGWGVFGGQSINQSAFFTATAPVTTSNGLIFTLPQNYNNDHHINQFRLSYTTDAAPGAGSSWTQLAPGALLANGGITLANVGSNMIRATDPANSLATYQVTAPGSYSNVTGFRVELFPVDLGGGPVLGRASNGNLVLSEFLTHTADNFNWALGKQASANAANYDGYPPINITDGDPNTFSHPNTDVQSGFTYTVDLGGTINLTSLALLNRADGCCTDRLSNYTVKVLDANNAQVWTGNIHTDGSDSGVGGTDTIVAGDGAGTFAGRYIQVINNSGTAYSPQIAELQAFGSPVPEPTSIGAIAVLAGLGLRRRRA